MARPKLQSDQKLQLLTWLAAEYSGPLIIQEFKRREWPEIGLTAISYYRKRHAAEIAALREQRRTAAVTSGLALKEERIARLIEHADEMFARRWEADKNGRLWNEKAWREILDDIAKELGHRRQATGGINLNLTPEELAQLSDDDLERLKQQIA